MYEIRKTKEKERCKNETKQQRYYIDCACHNNSTNAIKVIPFIFFNFSFIVFHPLFFQKILQFNNSFK